MFRPIWPSSGVDSRTKQATKNKREQDIPSTMNKKIRNHTI
jgi:hypothetical protein